MYKIAAIIGGVLLMAGVALGGTVTSLGSTDSPTLSKLPLAASTTAPTTGQDDRGREAEQRGRANDPRCTGVVSTATVTTRVDDERRGPNRGHDGGEDHGGNSGPGGGESGHGGHGGDDD